MLTIFFRFLLNHLWKCQKAWWPNKETVKRMNKFQQVYSVKLISVCKQNVSKPVTLNELKFSYLPYNKHLINRVKSICMGESWSRSCVQTSLRSVCTHDLGQVFPIQTSCSVNESYTNFDILKFSVLIKTIDNNTGLAGINPTNHVAVILRSLVLRSIFCFPQRSENWSRSALALPKR